MRIVDEFQSVYHQGTMYLVIEEPGDMTRYNHLIHVTDGYISCIGYDIDWGAKLKKQLTFQKDYLKLDYCNLIGMEPHDAVEKVQKKFINGYEIHEEDNIFTTASAIRCMQEILKDKEK